MNSLRHQHIYDLAELCYQQGIRHAVICPGSRSAPLVLGFSNHPSIRCRVIPDERTAGFIALGIAQATKSPVILICTSGSAAYHFAPAIAEAYYQEIPLIVCTADRPGEWIGQRDGQTIVQNNIYGAHVKKFFDVQAEDQPEGSWLSNRMMNEAILTSVSGPAGPVHLNFPFREPLYPSPADVIKFRSSRSIKESAFEKVLDRKEIQDSIRKISTFRRILLVAGQHPKSKELRKKVDTLKIPVITEIISNLNGIKAEIRNADLILGTAGIATKNKLRPDLLITWGQGVISKQLKVFLRNHQAKEHWHIQSNGAAADTFKQLSKIFRCTPEYFTREILLKASNQSAAKKKEYFEKWKSLDHTCETIIQQELKNSHSEAMSVRTVLNQLPGDYDLHLANSMSVRHANLSGLPKSNKSTEVFSNRGTSGIDGCTATAVGHQLIKKNSQLLITGDVAFFYDSNAFWHDEKPDYLRICLINNHGGRIFQVIDGPKGRKETEKYFVGPQARIAETFCKENRITYMPISAEELLNETGKKQLIKFFKSGKDIRLIEIFCKEGTDSKVLEHIKKRVSETIL